MIIGIIDNPARKPRVWFVYGPNPWSTRTIQTRCPFDNKLKDIDIVADTDTVPVHGLCRWVKDKISATSLFEKRTKPGRSGRVWELRSTRSRSSNAVPPSLIELDTRLPSGDGYAIATLLGSVPSVQQHSLAIGNAARAEATMVHPSFFEMVSKLTDLKSMELQLMSRFLVTQRIYAGSPPATSASVLTPPVSSDYKSF